MGKALILLSSGQKLICVRDENLDDKEAADALLIEVIQKKSVNVADSFIRCENGGGFDAKLVIAVTILSASQEAIQEPEEVS